MKPSPYRAALFAVLVCQFALLASATAPDEALSPEERAQRLQRNQDLIELVVDASVRLAAEDDPVNRAEQCTKLADRLADEMSRSANQHESQRVTELGQYLHLVLDKGVADNLSAARKRMPQGSAEAQRLVRAHERAAKVLRPLDDWLSRAAESEECEAMRQALKAVREAQSKSDGTVRGVSRRSAGELIP